MEVREAIEARRAYRSLEKTEITKDIIRDLAKSAGLAPSWRFVFVYDEEILHLMFEALSPGNKWAQACSMIVVVFSKKDDDCHIKEREYYLFDTGMATGLLILRATELGLVAHPIAGYNPNKVGEILGIPDEYNIITLIIVGKHSDDIGPLLNEAQVEIEGKRPERLSIDKFVYLNRYGGTDDKE